MSYPTEKELTQLLGKCCDLYSNGIDVADLDVGKEVVKQVKAVHPVDAALLRLGIDVDKLSQDNEQRIDSVYMHYGHNIAKLRYIARRLEVSTGFMFLLYEVYGMEYWRGLKAARVPFILYCNQVYTFDDLCSVYGLNKVMAKVALRNGEHVGDVVSRLRTEKLPTDYHAQKHNCLYHLVLKNDDDVPFDTLLARVDLRNVRTI